MCVSVPLACVSCPELSNMSLGLLWRALPDPTKCNSDQSPSDCPPRCPSLENRHSHFPNRLRQGGKGHQTRHANRRATCDNLATATNDTRRELAPAFSSAGELAELPRRHTILPGDMNCERTFERPPVRGSTFLSSFGLRYRLAFILVILCAVHTNGQQTGGRSSFLSLLPPPSPLIDMLRYESNLDATWQTGTLSQF